jgi:TonB family protein
MYSAFCGFTNLGISMPVGKLLAVVGRLVVVLLVGASLNQAATAKTYDVVTEETVEFKKAEVVNNPMPTIPVHLQEQAHKSSCVAQFKIAPDGKTQIRLLTSSGNDEIDDITLGTLRQWKFKPAMLDGKPIVSTRRLKVEFEIN